MAIQLVDLGELINDGTGDDLRTAFIKVNNNFGEIEERLPDSISGVNLGTEGEGIFASAVGSVLNFKKIDNGLNLSVTSNSNKITLDLNRDQNIELNADITAITVTADNFNANSVSVTDNVSATNFVGDLDGNVFRVNTPIAIASVTESNADFEPIILNALTISGNNSINNGVTDISTTVGDGLRIFSDQLLEITSNNDIILSSPQVFVIGELNATLYGNVYANNRTSLLVDADNSVLRGLHIGSLEGNVVGNTSGIHTGAVFGDTTGFHTGNVLGNVTGDVTGNLNGNVIGTVSSISNHTLSDLGDVSETVPLLGQALVWSGTVWSPGTVATGTGSGFNVDGGSASTNFDVTTIVLDGGGA